MDEEQDGLIDRQPEEKRQSRRQRRVADMRAILFRPSLHHDSEHNQRNAELREADMNLIEDRSIPAGMLIQCVMAASIVSPVVGFDEGEGFRPMDERRIHRIFQISIIIKGLHATIECAGGIALYFVSTTTIVRWVELLTQDELAEDPRDFVATHFLSAAQHLSVGTETFYAFYLLSHGLVKVFLVAGLLKEKLWAYPASLAVLGAFIAYQAYRYSFTHSIGLIILTVFDLIVIWLVWHEWRVLRQHLAIRSLEHR